MVVKTRRAAIPISPTIHESFPYSVRLSEKIKQVESRKQIIYFIILLWRRYVE